MDAVETVTDRPNLSFDDLAERARELRIDTLKMTHWAGSGHPGGSFSEAELLVYLYYNRLNVDPSDPAWPDRDRFVLSKGHACPGHYAVLGQLGFFPRSEFRHLRKIGHLLQGHSDVKVPGVEMSAGSLGQGLSFANGCAMAARLDDAEWRTFVMLGDGECQEGQVWEAAMTSAHYGLDNLTAIVDANQIQIEGFTRDIMDLEPLVDKFESFGWHVLEIDGHDFAQIEKAVAEADGHIGQPTMIVARTVKGKGVSFMENKNAYHGRSLDDEEMARAMEELGAEWPLAEDGDGAGGEA